MGTSGEDWLVAKSLTAVGFRHAFTTRRLDFSPTADREGSAKRLADDVGFAPSRLFQVHQVHGARVVRVAAESDPASMRREQADALVASLEGAAVGVRTADCVPVLVGNPKTGEVAAIHAGWKGTVAGVVRAGVREMGGDPQDLIAAIGPCIGPCCFEVGNSVAAEIAAACGDAGVVVRAEGAKARVDLRRAVRAELRLAGVAEGHIEDVPGCTLCDAARFFSFRRAQEEGRMLAVIVAR